MRKEPHRQEKLTPQEQRNLDIEIEFIEGVVRRDPHYVQALQVLGDDYTRRGKYLEGLAVDERLARLRPGDAWVHYNLACSYSLTRHYEAATATLERALALGYRDFKWMARDPDLENLRKHPLYRKVRAQIRALQIKVR